MVGVGKWLSHRVVAPICVGSNPTIHPKNIGVSPSGKATDSDSVMRRFESCYPSQFNMMPCKTQGMMWRHSQVVRHWSAKPLFPGSNLGVASIKKLVKKFTSFLLPIRYVNLRTLARRFFASLRMTFLKNIFSRFKILDS